MIEFTFCALVIFIVGILILTQKLTHHLGLLWSFYLSFLFCLCCVILFFKLNSTARPAFWIGMALYHLLLLFFSLKLEKIQQKYKNYIQGDAIKRKQISPLKS